MTSTTGRTQKTDAALASDPAAPAETEALAAGDVAAAPAVDSAAPAAAPAADPNMVTIKLANPIDKISDIQRLGLDETRLGGYNVHDEITVSLDNARTLITAGYAQVDPEDQKAVDAALTPSA